jgi:hypothetical protein
MTRGLDRRSFGRAMTPTAPPTAPTFIQPDRRPARSAGRRVAIVLGSLAALFGAILVLAGGALLAIFGGDGVAWTDREDLSTPTAALVSGTASIDTDGVVDDLAGTRVRIDARADGGKPIFVGVGPAADVERYLAGAGYDEVTDLDAGPFESTFGVDRDRHPGAATPDEPGTQPFWVAQDTGRDGAALDWKVRDGDYRVVVMNADGSRDVQTSSELGVRIPWITGVAIGVLVAGLLVLAGGFGAIVAGARRTR